MNIEPAALPSPPPQKKLIPSTEVDDTAENRRVITFCEKYRAAVEAKDVEALVAMASPRYQDQDIDYASLAGFLRGSFGHADAIRYDVLYKHVWFQGNQVLVDYTYSASYRTGKDWKRSTDDNRLVLEPDGDSFRILRGM